MSENATNKKVYFIGGAEITNIKEIKIEHIKADIMEKDTDDIQWLIDTMETSVEKKKKGKVVMGEDGKPIMRAPTFIDVRNAFVAKYFPELAPKGKQKTDKMKDTLAELQAALAAKQG